MKKNEYLGMLIDTYRQEIERNGPTKGFTVSTGDMQLLLDVIMSNLNNPHLAEAQDFDNLEACFDCSLPVFAKSDQQRLFVKGSIYAVCDRCWRNRKNENLQEHSELVHYRRFVMDNQLDEKFERYMQNSL